MAKGVTIRDDRHGEEKLRRRLKAMTKTMVVAGITHEAQADNPTGPTVAQYAIYNELGLGVPARPFMGRYYDNNLEQIAKFATNAIRKAIMETVTYDAALNAIGLYMQKGIKQSIQTAWQWAVPNSPITLQRKYIKGAHAFKKKRGRAAADVGPQRPKELIDHGIMLNSVTFDIRPRNNSR